MLRVINEGYDKWEVCKRETQGGCDGVREAQNVDDVLWGSGARRLHLAVAGDGLSPEAMSVQALRME